MLSEILASLRAKLLSSSSLAQETTQNGQTLNNGFFQSVVVENTPAFVLNNDFARFLNFGQVETNGAPSAVSVEADDVQVFNFRTGSIEANGPVATGVEVTDGSSADIRNFGSIAGELNGVEFSGANSSGTLDNFRGGVISSDSRAVEIEGQGISVRNFGDIIGTGNQRNGTIYTNATAEDVSISNFSGGTIDAGEGNSGAGISLQVGDEAGDVVSNTIFNGFGATIQGRGQEAANTGGAGDGIRIDDGAEGAVSDTDIVNSGLISSESEQGTAGGIRIADGVSAEGRILNTSTGVIEGAANGLYIGQGEHDLDVLNFGTIQSDSRAVNIDGTGVNLINGGDILGTDDQRNGTLYADGTADDFSVSNLASGTIDAGEGNQGSGFGAEIGGAEDGANTFELDNDGTIQGRGNAAAGSNLAGDGVRIGNVGNLGTTDATITNSGEILSEGANGTVAGLRVVNGVNFQGSLTNSGLIAGVQNGVYFGTGDHAGGTFVNEGGGVVSSDSRALNIDGDGLNVVNNGSILGTGDQRNGTVYADGTADNYTFTNAGLVDAGLGNNGSGVSLQTGDVAGDVVSAAIFNEGLIQGRGDAAEGNTIGDGLRLFSNQEDASFAGLVQNEGVIAGSAESDVAAGIRIDGGLDLLGAIINEGEISGSVNAIDATEAGDVTFVNDSGIVNGNVLLGAGEDIVVDLGQINGVLDGGAGDDVLIAGEGDNIIVGGLGNDFVDGGDGFDTADYSDLDVGITVALNENGNGTVTRDTGFTIVTDPVVIPNGPGASVQPTNVVDGATFVSEALAGNFYFNVHTSDVLGGEIRGQLDTVVSNEEEHGIRTIVLTGDLDADQEVGTGSESEATGTGTLVITYNENTGAVSYTSELSVVGLNEADLQTPAPGVASAIHLHNAPAGQNGPIVRDTLVDAGGIINGDEPTGIDGADEVIENQVEVDVLSSIERVVGSDDVDTVDLSGFNGVTIDLDVNTPNPGPASQDGVVLVDGEVVLEVDDFENVLGSSGDDLILGNNEINVLEGLGGNDSIHSFGGADTIDGGEGVDTALFSAGAGVIVDLDEGGNAIAQINAPDGELIDTVLNFENINGSNNAGSANGGNDILSGNSGANTLNGQAGDDVLNGEGGNDILIGGEGADTFTFEGLFGADTVNDFQSGIDQLNFTDFGDDFGSELVVEAVDGGTLLTLGNNGSVLLAGVDSIDTDNDFVA